MPQLMPLYWIMSTIMILLMLLYMLKFYGNFFKTLNFKKIVLGGNYEKWYW